MFFKKLFCTSLFRCMLMLAVFSAAVAPAGSALAAKPAPAGGAELRMFGANLFQGNFVQEKITDQELAVGDSLVIRLWGDINFDAAVVIPESGEIEIPELGQMPVAGLLESQLSDTLRSKLNATGHEATQIYARLLNSQPIYVFVTGAVAKPGRYAGASADSVLAFLDKAGGIDPKRGSYRNISLLRADQEVAEFDLYPFALRGQLPAVRLQNADTIVVRDRGVMVSAYGDCRNAARFELKDSELSGESIVRLTDPAPAASHVSVKGTRNNAPYNLYLSVRDFSSMPLADGDSVQFLADTPGNTIMVEVQGAIRGASRFPLRNGTRLKDLLQYIAVDPVMANLTGLYVKRKSVAARQKIALDEALRRLQQSSMTAISSSSEEAEIRAKESEMIAKFAEKAANVEPEGIVVVGHNGKIADIALEDGDIIVIPEKSDVILVTGEVVMPQALVWQKGKSLKYYIKGAGGFTNRADSDGMLLIRPNGEVLEAENDLVGPGDQLMVLPRFDSKNMQLVKDISQIAYQIAVAAKVIVTF